MNQIVTGLWQDKERRNLAILVMLIVLLVTILTFTLPKDEPKRSTKLLICKECREPETRSFINLDSELCNKCEKKGKMLYSLKCSACDYEFGVKPIPKNQLAELSKKERAEAHTLHKICPNCSSLETFSLVNYAALKEAMEKVKAKTKAKAEK